jgi:hypothetical protein
MRKLGKFQQKIFDDILKHGTMYQSLIYANHAPWVHSGAERNGHSDYSRVEKVLNRLEELGLIKIFNRNTNICNICAIVDEVE